MRTRSASRTPRARRERESGQLGERGHVPKPWWREPDLGNPGQAGGRAAVAALLGLVLAARRAALSRAGR